MKKILSVLFILAFCINIYAQNGGMEFTKGDWETVLATAKKENKMVFIDAYAVWCSPCKMMSNKVFPLKEVGDFYNKQFINVKIDMEKGEGPELAKKYGVDAYPTYLFVDSNGDLVHRGVGYIPTESFVDLGEAATDPDRQYVTLMKRYEKGDRNPDFLLKYAKAMGSAGLDAADIADEYLAVEKNWFKPETMEFIYNYSSRMGTQGFSFMAENQAAFAKKFGKEKVVQRLEYAIHRGSRGNAALVKTNLKKYLPQEAERLIAKFDVQILMNSSGEENHRKFEKAATAYLMKYGSTSWRELNSICWHFYEVSENKEVLKFAAKWAKKSVKMNSHFYNNDTLAALYYKLENKKKAMKYAKIAVARAKKTGEDPMETEKLIEKIQTL